MKTITVFAVVTDLPVPSQFAHDIKMQMQTLLHDNGKAMMLLESHHLPLSDTQPIQVSVDYTLENGIVIQF